MSIGASNLSKTYAPPLQSTLNYSEGNNSLLNLQDSSQTEKNQIDSPKPPNTVKTLAKLLLNTLFSALTYVATYSIAGGLWFQQNGRGSQIIEFLHNHMPEKKKKYLENLSNLGPKGHEATHEVTNYLKTNPNHLAEWKKHLSRRKIWSGSIIAFLSWVRAVFFSSNTDWNNLHPFSGTAIACGFFPLLSNILGYRAVYDLNKPGQLAYGFLTPDILDRILDTCKAVLKGLKHWKTDPNKNNSSFDLHNIVSLLLLILVAGGSRAIRNHIIEPKLVNHFMSPKGRKFTGPKSLQQATEVSLLRAAGKSVCDTAIFGIGFSVLSYLVSKGFSQKQTPVNNPNYYGLNGLTSQLNQPIAA